jgi:hypothetical protein
MTFEAWPVLFAIAFHALIFHALPRVSRTDILFAVTVPEPFASGEGRALVSRYRAIVWTGAVIAIVLVLLLRTPVPDSGRWGSVYIAAIGANLLAGMSAWVWAHRHARAHAVPHSDQRVASLVPRDTSLPGGVLFASGPFGILLIAAVLVVTHLDQVNRGIRALGPLAVAALYVTVMLTMAVSMSRRTRQIAVEGMAAALEQRFRRLNVLVIVLVAYGVAVQLSVVTLQSIPAFAATFSPRIEVMLLPLMLFNLGAAFWMFRVGQGGQRAATARTREDTHGDATPDEAWKIGGLFYFNPKDPALWVEKRIGFGYTLNMGNSNAWLLIGMMLLPMIAVRLLFS